VDSEFGNFSLVMLNGKRCWHGAKNMPN
jgi:hypothetical protein